MDCISLRDRWNDVLELPYFLGIPLGWDYADGDSIHLKEIGRRPELLAEEWGKVGNDGNYELNVELVILEIF